MKINGEECEQVKSFAELQAGMIVWIVECAACERKHRCLLLSCDDDPAEVVDTGEVVEDEPSWNFAPDASCGINCIPVDHFEEPSIVYRVVESTKDNARRVKRKERAR